jgi:hypothetical protein
LDDVAQRLDAQRIRGQSGEDTHQLVQIAAVELEEKGLLEGRGVGADGVSRRAALRRLAGVGVAAVAAPLVISASVPKPADAAGSPLTCIHAGQTCNHANTVNSGNNCCPGSGTSNLYCNSTSTCAACFATGGTPTGANACPSGSSTKSCPACCSGQSQSGTCL